MAPLLPFGTPPTPDATLTVKGKVKFITQGTNGILGIRWQTPTTGEIWDSYIDSTGHLVTTAVVVGAFALLLETGDYLLLETGDKLLTE